MAVLLVGCAHTPRVTTATRDAIYKRAEVHFDQTVLVKPDESAEAVFRLAPLLVQQILSTNDVSGVPFTVYFWQTFARAGDRSFEQFNYVWFSKKSPQHPRISQGVRITFDRVGKPFLWEVLRDPTGARILFVSQALEAAARTNYPAPLPGRRFWVERSVTEAPATVVARVIEDSATVMGPIVYVEAGTQNISTLICRCMDAQAQEVVGLGTYGLAKPDETVVRWLIQDKPPGLARWLPGKPPDDLTQWLRLQPR